jgi:hypothetical protein
VVEDAADPPVSAEQAEPPTPPVLVEEEVVEEPTAYSEPTPDPVPEEPAPDATSEPAVEELVGKSKEAVAGKFERLTGEIEAKVKAALSRIKSVSQSDAKKVAAAVVGVWGASAGVGWIAQNTNSNKKI